MHADHLKERFHGALNRGAAGKHATTKLTEREIEEITLVMLAVVTEALTEIAVVVADLATRVEQIEGRATTT